MISLNSRVQQFISQPRKVLIDGRWVAAKSGETFDVFNPATGQHIARAAACEKPDVDAAVAAAGGPIDLVKMDCEGGEYDLVYASSPDNWSSVQRLVIEYHPVACQSWNELRSWLEKVGLTVQYEESHGGVGVAFMSRQQLPPVPA